MTIRRHLDTLEQLREMQAKVSALIWQEESALREALRGSQYQSPDVPEGYQTVLGYLEAYRPDLLALMEDDPEQLAEDTKRDGWWLKHRCRERGIEPVKVKAPPMLADQGIEDVNAYPLTLLEARLG